MKQMNFIVPFAFMAVLAFGREAVASGGTGFATATILSGVLVTRDANAQNSGYLAFGTIIPSATTSGTVTVEPANGQRSASAGVTLTGAANSYSPAAFNVSGMKNASYAIYLPGGSVTISNGSATMTVGTWSHNKTRFLLGGSGQDTFRGGGTLHVGANQAEGVYTGTFDLVVTYN